MCQTVANDYCCLRKLLYFNELRTHLLIYCFKIQEIRTKEVIKQCCSPSNILLNYAILSSRAKVYSFKQIDVQTLNGQSEQIYIVKTDFLILQGLKLSFSAKSTRRPSILTITTFIVKNNFVELGYPYISYFDVKRQC